MRRRVVSLAAPLTILATIACADALDGQWVLNVERSHYGPGARPRRRETFVCASDKDVVECEIDSQRVDGTRVVGRFTAADDGTPRPAMGIPEVDQVTLRRVDDFAADATFSYRGKPVFGYRVVKSDDGQSLTIISVEPTSRAVLTSVIVYDRQSRGHR